MPAFRDWTIQDARAAIAKAIEDTVGEDGFESNKAYAEDHDHWQDGATWPAGGAVGSPVRTAMLAAVEPQFVTRDAIAEVQGRRANGLMQREPDVAFQALDPAAEGSDEEKKQKAEAAQYLASLSAWWDRVKFWEKARKAFDRAGWSGRGALRPWLPSGRLVESTVNGAVVRTIPNNLTFDEALLSIALDAPLPDAVAVVVDPDTQQAAAVVLYEVETADGAGTETQAELWFTEGDKTITRILTEAGGDANEEHSIMMGGRLPINEMATDVLITEPVRSLQARLNFFETLLSRAGEAAMFPERYIGNAEPNGIWLTTPPAEGTTVLRQEVFNGVTMYLHAAPRTLGHAITTELIGRVIGTEADGTTPKLATPFVERFDPTDPDYVIKACAHAHKTILGQCKQGHVALEGTAEASGTAYQQARADFEADLGDVKPPLEGMLRDTLEAVVAMAESMTRDKPRILERFRIAVTLNISSGPITPLERQQNNEDVKAGTMSRASAMARGGIEDVGAELQRMSSQPESVIELRRKQVDAVTVLHAEGMTWTRSAKIIGIDDPALLKMFTEQDAEDRLKRKQEDAQDKDIDDVLNPPADRVLVEA